MRRFRFLGAALATAVLTFAMAMPASAAVVSNETLTLPFSVINPCDPADGVITGTFNIHVVVKSNPDGSSSAHENVYGQGTSTVGTKYVVSAIVDRTSATGSSFSFTERFHLVSAGGDDNLFITATFSSPPPTIISFTSECRR